MELLKPPGIIGVQRRPPIYAEGPQVFSGVDNRTGALTINGATETPVLRYKLGDAGAGGCAAWGYGSALSIGGGAGAAIEYNTKSIFYGTANDDACTFAGTGAAGDAVKVLDLGAAVDLLTKDIVLHAVVQPSVAAAGAGMIVQSGLSDGFDLRAQAGGAWSFFLKDAGVGSLNVASAAVGVGAWLDLWVFVNRDESSANGSAIIINGAQSGAGVDLSAYSGSISSDVNLGVGGVASDGTYAFSGKLALVEMWLRDNWHQAGAAGPAEWATVVAEHFSRLSGTFAQHAPPGASVPTVTRATTAYYYRSDQSLLHLAGSGLAPVEVEGLPIYGAATNVCLYSQTIGSGAAWSEHNATITDDSVAAPDGTTTADTLNEDGVDTYHDTRQNLAAFTATTKYVLSGYCKKANRTWIRPDLYHASQEVSVYFDVDNQTVGTATGVDASGIIDIDAEWCRWWFTFTATQSAAYLLLLTLADANGSVSYQGLTQAGIYLWGVQLETGTYPSSYIPTVAAAVTRNADNVDLDTDIADRLNAAGQGTIECEVMQAAAVPATKIGTIIELGTDATHRLNLYIGAGAGDVLAVYCVDGTAQANGNTAPTVHLATGVTHRVAISWRLNRIVLKVNNDAAILVDNACTIPAITGVAVGRKLAGTDYLNGHVRITGIYDYARH